MQANVFNKNGPPGDLIIHANSQGQDATIINDTLEVRGGGVVSQALLRSNDGLQVRDLSQSNIVNISPNSGNDADIESFGNNFIISNQQQVGLSGDMTLRSVNKDVRLESQTGNVVLEPLISTQITGQIIDANISDAISLQSQNAAELSGVNACAIGSSSGNVLIDAPNGGINMNADFISGIATKGIDLQGDIGASLKSTNGVCFIQSDTSDCNVNADQNVNISSNNSNLNINCPNGNLTSTTGDVVFNTGAFNINTSVISQIVSDFIAFQSNTQTAIISNGISNIQSNGDNTVSSLNGEVKLRSNNSNIDISGQAVNLNNTPIINAQTINGINLFDVVNQVNANTYAISPTIPLYTQESQIEYNSSEVIGIQADAGPPIDGIDSWRYINNGVGGFNKINWYLGLNQEQTDTNNQKTVGTCSYIYFVAEFNVNSSQQSMPFISTYTKLTGSGDASSWYHSRNTYAIQNADRLTVGTGTKALFYINNDPTTVEPGINHYELGFNAGSSVGDTWNADPTQQHLLTALSSDSGAPANQVDFKLYEWGYYIGGQSVKIETNGSVS